MLSPFRVFIPEISFIQSKAIVKDLQDNGYINKETSELMEDPRRSDWRVVLSQFSHLPNHPMEDSLVADKSPISELMNVAYGLHEITRDGVQEALKFCMNMNDIS